MKYEIVYNWAQEVFIASPQSFIMLEWSRGAGKTIALSRRSIDCVFQMPRSSGAIVGSTFAQLKNFTMPSLLKGLAIHQYYKDIHYVVGKAPPKNWPQPYSPPLDYRNVISWINGTCQIFVSQDESASSGRGPSYDWIIGDEAALLKQKKFMEDVFLSTRGNLYQVANYPDGSWEYYKDCSLHQSVALATTTPVTLEGQWVLEYEELAKLYPDKYAFWRADARVNVHNLGDDYFERQKEILPDFIYDAEVLNKRISKIENGFYPSLDESIHCYNSFDNEYYLDLKSGLKPTCIGDNDLDPNEPLIVSIDFGANINCLIASQASEVEHRFLKNFYVLSPKIIDNLIEDEFIPYYEPHENKEIYLWYDPSGNVKVPNSNNTYADEVCDLLRKHGWTVRRLTSPTGYNELHDRKYRLWIDVLQEKKTDIYPVIRINSTNCSELWISLTRSPAKQGLKQAVKKDKGSERSKKIKQEHATHFSDTADFQIVGMYMNRSINKGRDLSAFVR